MIILHCLQRATWDRPSVRHWYGRESIAECGFIHCSDLSTFQYVAPNFRDIPVELALLCIETDKLVSEIRWEDGDGSGMEFPHIYGLLNHDAVAAVLPYLRDDKGEWIPNPELKTMVGK